MLNRMVDMRTEASRIVAMVSSWTLYANTAGSLD